MKNILFRADSSSEIGIGHITRDLVLAKQYKLDSITFATQDLPGNINDYIRKCGHRLLHLKSNAVEEMINIISDEKIDMIVIDHYGIDLEYEKKLKEQCDILLLVLDDTYQPHFCDILLNHNLYADESKYAGLIPERCELRCGAEYTLIDDQFMDENLKISNLSDPRSHFNVFVAMGGSDHSNILMKILLVLAEYPNLRPIVVTSTAKQHLEELIKYVAGKASVSLHVNPENMASLMHNSDYAIITPSALVHEILQFQLPFIAIKTADNQSHMLEYLKDSHFITMECFDSELLLTNVRKLIGEPGSIFKNFIDLSMSEKLMILDWRNNPGIRKWMLVKETISQIEHLRFIDSLETNQDSIYLLVKNHGYNIGVIDFTELDREKNTAQFGVYANPHLRGVGNLLMEAIVKYAFEILNVVLISAVVFEKNVAAVKLYERHGFKIMNSEKYKNQILYSMTLRKDENS